MPPRRLSSPSPSPAGLPLHSLDPPQDGEGAPQTPHGRDARRRGGRPPCRGSPMLRGSAPSPLPVSPSLELRLPPASPNRATSRRRAVSSRAVNRLQALRPPRSAHLRPPLRSSSGCLQPPPTAPPTRVHASPLRRPRRASPPTSSRALTAARLLGSLPRSPTPPPTPTSQCPRSGRQHPQSGASTMIRSDPWPPLSAPNSASPLDRHATELAPSSASRYRVKSLISPSCNNYSDICHRALLVVQFFFSKGHALLHKKYGILEKKK
ncbi:hypothetical protein PVAP13_9KG509800 [Panicum virgatum]|uniref:Uncharacterized protein n=1 Tax=Panicum virgatum TaxID=38727 RepID=A0A8T0NUT9_PANVG|nr:hypothetical protein PVAP13_9KG509800 [Panicum virgatum]